MFKIVSFVDIITNSSTSIYTKTCGSIKEIHEIFDAVLSLAGSPCKSRDLFEVKEVIDSYELDSFIDPLDWKIRRENSIPQEIKEKYSTKLYSFIEDNKLVSPEEIQEFLKEICSELNELDLGVEFDHYEYSEKYNYNSDYVFTVKADVPKEQKEHAEGILRQINGLFTSDVNYDY